MPSTGYWTEPLSCRSVLRLDRDPDFLEETGRQDAARGNDHGLVGHLQQPALLLYDHGVFPYFLYVGIQQCIDAAGTRKGFDLVTVLWLGPGEGRRALGQRDDRPRLFRDTVGRLERAVASANDEHLHARILFGVDESIDDLGKFLAGHAESRDLRVLTSGPAPARYEL